MFNGGISRRVLLCLLSAALLWFLCPVQHALADSAVGDAERALRHYRDMEQAAGRDISLLLLSLQGQAKCRLFMGDYDLSLKALELCEEKALSHVQIEPLQRGTADRVAYRTLALLLQAHMAKVQILYDLGRYDRLMDTGDDPSWRCLHSCLSGYALTEAAALQKSPASAESLIMLDTIRTASVYESTVLALQGKACRETGDFAKSCEFLARASESLKPSQAALLSEYARNLKALLPSPLPSLIISQPPAGALDRFSAMDEEFQRRRMLIAIDLAKALTAGARNGDASLLIAEQERIADGFPRGQGYFQASLSLLRARHLCNAGDGAKALTFLDRAAESYSTMPVPDLSFISTMKGTMGEIAELSGKGGEALDCYEYAFDTVALYHDAGAVMISPACRYELLQRWAQGAQRILRSQARHEEAFLMGEKLRHATLYTLRGEPSFNRSMADMNWNVSLLKERCDEVILFPSPEASKEIRSLNIQMREGLTAARNMRNRPSRSFSMWLDSSPLSIREIQKHIDRDSALLLYSYEKMPPCRSCGLVLEVITAEAFKAIPLHIRGADMEKNVATLNQRIAGHSHLWNDICMDLYRECINPARQFIGGKKKLVIVADGMMSHLPFSMLQNSGGTVLMDSFDISHAPSASTWSLGRSMDLRASAPSPVIWDRCCTDGALYRGSEIPAFSVPFFDGGAHDVLFCLWETPVKNEGFEIFRREVQRCPSVQEALAITQRRIRKKYPLPLFWAPYVLYCR